MRSIRNNFKVIYIFLGVALVGLLIEFVDRTGLISGNWGLIRNDFISVFPYIIGIALAIWWFTRRG